LTKAEVSTMISASQDPVYKTLADIPDWGRPTVQKLVSKGLIEGFSGALNISNDMLRIIVLNDRAGLYK